MNQTFSQLRSITSRNLGLQYKGSVLGLFWILLEPILYMVILSIVFSQILRIEIERYPLFLLAGLLPWNFFSQALSNGTTSIVDDANLVRSSVFRRELLPIASVLTSFVNLVFALVLFAIVLVALELPLSGSVVFLPVVLALHILFATGLALLLSCAHAFFRDINNFVKVGVMLWFYLTPVLYPMSMVPERYATWHWLNPMVSFVDGYRSILLEAQAPKPGDLFVMAVAGATVAAGGILVFRKLAPGLAKVV